MKKLLFLFALLLAVPLSAQEDKKQSDRLYIAIGDSENLAQVPLMLYLENPTVDFTALEFYLTLPDGVSISDGVVGNSAAHHFLVEGDTPDGYFISIASESLATIEAASTPLCTWYCDFSQLLDGDYTISAAALFAVAVIDGEVVSYTAENHCEQFTIDNGGDTTSVASVLSAVGELVIYNINGLRIAQPQEGVINIINGKKVKL